MNISSDRKSIESTLIKGHYFQLYWILTQGKLCIILRVLFSESEEIKKLLRETYQKGLRLKTCLFPPQSIKKHTEIFTLYTPMF